MRTLQRRTAGLVVAAVGVAFVVSVVVNHLFSVGPAFERMSDGFRPAMTPAAVAELQASLDTLGAVGPEFETKGIPMVAQALGMTPEQLTAFIGQQYPDVATGLQQLPSIVAQFRGVVGVLGAEQARFERADAIPTSNLPATTIPWGLAIAGIVLVGFGVLMVIRPIRLWAGVALVIGALLVIVPLAISLPGKASAADTMNDHLKPVYTAQMLTGARGALATVGTMGQQMQTEMLPALGQQLGMDEAQLQAFLGQNLPAVAAGMRAMPSAMPMFQNMVATFESHLGDWTTLKSVPFVPIVWTMIIGGIVALLAATLALVPARKQQEWTEELVELKAA